MKTITIPDYKNPFTVTINNNVYKYKGGETIEVPDEVAEAIEDALELEPKPKRYLSKFAQLANGTLTEITASDFEEVETISDSAFYKRKNLISVTVPDSVTSIGESAFYSCSNLESIRFGASSKLKSIGLSAFNYSKLLYVYLPLTPPTLEHTNAFANISTFCVFYCKTQESLNAYKAATNWSTLTGTYSFVVEE